MKRITVRRAKVAYAKTGLLPERGVTLGDTYACPIGACVAAEIKVAGNWDVGTYAAWLGLSDDYATDFVRGFDGKHRWAISDEAMLGYRDGEACRRTLLPEHRA